MANVKSSAMRPRQPDVPNLMGEAIMYGYCMRADIVHKDERARQKDGGGGNEREETDLTHMAQGSEHPRGSG